MELGSNSHPPPSDLQVSVISPQGILSLFGSLKDKGQIHAQVPWEAPEAGLVDVVIRAEAPKRVLESEPMEVPLVLVAQAMRPFDFGPGRAAALNVQLRADDDVINNPVAQPEGAFPGRDSPPVPIGGVEAPVDCAGLSRQFVGLYQINAFVPQGVVPGPQVPVIIEQNGVRSRDDVTIAVRLP